MTAQQTLSQYAIDALAAIGPLVVAIVGVLAARATAWVKAHTRNALVLGAMTRLSAEVSTAVAAAEQTAVADLKAKSGGTLSVIDAVTVKNDEIKLILSNLGGDKAIAEVQKILGVDDIRAYLGNLIEAEVLKLNTSAAPVASAVAVAPVAAR